jgi:hypothetical protein
VRVARLAPTGLARLTPHELAGAILLEQVQATDCVIAKGRPLDHDTAARLVAAAANGGLGRPVKLAWPGDDDVHEDEAAAQLARAIGGAGVELRPPRQSRLDLAATWDGVLHLRTEPLRRLNAIDPLEVFTLLHGQAVAQGQVVCAVKVAPHLIPASILAEGLRIAKAEGPLAEVRPYRRTEVGAIAFQALTPDALERFEHGARQKIEALGSTFVGVVLVPDDEPDRAEAGATRALTLLVRGRALPLVLVGGVSAGDPLSPFYAALDRLGGKVVRRGVPAHPGSMIWLARLDRTQILGLPHCGVFSLATAVDLVLPRLLTGEILTAESLADLAHGGLLGREMRFRMPAYARELPAPEDP